MSHLSLRIFLGYLGSADDAYRFELAQTNFTSAFNFKSIVPCVRGGRLNSLHRRIPFYTGKTPCIINQNDVAWRVLVRKNCAQLVHDGCVGIASCRDACRVVPIKPKKALNVNRPQKLRECARTVTLNQSDSFITPKHRLREAMKDWAKLYRVHSGELRFDRVDHIAKVGPSFDEG